MGSSSQATFWTQAGALFRKNAAYQGRNRGTNIRILLLPLLFCVLLAVLQVVVNNALTNDDTKCGCRCLLCCDNRTGREVCKTASDADPCVPGEFTSCKQQDTSQCGLAYSSASQAAFCPITAPVAWPPFLQIPNEQYRAQPYRPAAAMLYTGADRSTADALAGLLFQAPDLSDAAAVGRAGSLLSAGAGQLGQGARVGPALAEVNVTVATPGRAGLDYYVEGAFVNATAIFNVLPDTCSGDASTATLNAFAGATNGSGGGGGGGSFFRLPFSCAAALPVWAPSAANVSRQLFCGFKQAQCPGSTGALDIQGISQAWDWNATTPDRLSLGLWYNDSSQITAGQAPLRVLRVNKGLNLAANAFLRWALGSNASAVLDGVMEMPKPGSKLSLNFSSLLGPLFFTWLLELLLPVMVVTLVAEKELGLRTMMRMHGLSQGAYACVMYAWYLCLYWAYALLLVAFASAINLSFFRLTSYAWTLVFLWLWGFTLVSSAFLASVFFTSSKTALVSTYLYVFATGLLGNLLLANFMGTDAWWTNLVELVPAWALYRGLYIQGEYAFLADYQGGTGLTFADFSADGNGLGVVFGILAGEAVVFLALAWYLEQVLRQGKGVRRHPLFFLPERWQPRRRRPSPTQQEQEMVPPHVKLAAPASNGSSLGKADADAQGERPDVAAERERVAGITNLADFAIVTRDLRKVYPAQDGNAAKEAVRGLTLAVRRGECFGLLGPNGAGKTSAIHMLVGLQEPSGGNAYVNGASILTDMAHIQNRMGVCPQHDLLWDLLTPAEHLRFYGRLKNLRGPELEAAVERSLRSVNLWAGGLATKKVGQFSGGMKRRLSVAISLIGDPAAVYMDEPSTGLDPASRRTLWDVVRQAKAGRGIVLTTHSMQEAEVLCDRLGMFVDGRLVCLGAPRELTARYGGYLVFTVTTPPGPDAEAAEAMVRRLCPAAVKTYSLAGTQKFELPAADVRLSAVFAAVEAARAGCQILDWGVSNSTLEEVFIKFARSLGVEGGA